MNLCRPGSRELFSYGQELNLILRWDKSALRAQKSVPTLILEKLSGSLTFIAPLL